MSSFQVTKECESVLRTSLEEVRERITEGTESKLQRRHTSVVDWKGQDNQRQEGEIRTVVTNPVTAENTLTCSIDVMIPSAIIEESLHGRRHTLSDAGYGEAESALNAILGEELSAGRGRTTVRLKTAAVPSAETFSYYGKIQVTF